MKNIAWLLDLPGARKHGTSSPGSQKAAFPKSRCCVPQSRDSVFRNTVFACVLVFFNSFNAYVLVINYVIILDLL